METPSVPLQRPPFAQGSGQRSQGEESLYCPGTGGVAQSGNNNVEGGSLAIETAGWALGAQGGVAASGFNSALGLGGRQLIPGGSA